MASILQLHCVLLGESSDQRKRVPGSALKAYFDISYTMQHSLRLNYLLKTAAKLQTSSLNNNFRFRLGIGTGEVRADWETAGNMASPV